MGDCACLAAVNIATVAAPGLELFSLKSDHFHRPAIEGLWLVGQHANGRQLPRLVARQRSEDAQLRLQLVDPPLTIK